MRVSFVILVLSAFCSFAFGADNLVNNGDFESGVSGWRAWSRRTGAIKYSTDTVTFHQGQSALRIEHGDVRDWSLEPNLRLPGQPGDIIELECWVKVQGNGVATLCFSTWSTPEKAEAWSYGERQAYESPGWQHLKTRVIVPSGIVQLQPRLIGYGPATVWVDQYSVIRQGNLSALRSPDLPSTLALSNAALVVTFDTAAATLSVKDSRSGRSWTQKSLARDCLVRSVRVQPDRLSCELIHGASGLDLTATFQLDKDQPELLAEISGQGEMPGSIPFPCSFAGESGDYLVVPMNEGISFPVDDSAISPMRLIAYGGHGICMAFYGMTDGARGQMAILETPDDASIRIDRVQGRLAIQPEWEAQRGQFGYTRKLRYVFFDQGGHVAMAKRYRAYARQAGLLKTLAEKRQFNPSVDLLVGAVNVWCWDRDAVSLARDMQKAGIERILWSNQQSPGNIKALNDLGVLTSRYDIYQDVMAPTNFPRLRWIHPDWTSNAWPQDIILDRHGQWIKGWGVESKDGPLIPCGVICDKQALDYARQRAPADLATHAYRCRFIDTTTAAPWHECYHPSHPMTRSESRQWKMELLRYMSEDLRLVTGCETGHDAAVPFLHYFEGMLSLGPYRVPDAGRRMSEIWTNVPEVVAKFQLGHNYRLPLWELVYHDCVVAQWYWGDYNNKLPALWDKRDLFNLLYGVPPMFMFNQSLWEKNKARFVQSYTNTCPTVRQVGYSEMTNHRFLTPDRTVQQTVFANQVTIAVNFGSTPYRMPDGRVIKPLGFLVDSPQEPVSLPVPGWFPKAPPLPPLSGPVLRVASVPELYSAVDRCEAGSTVLLADGHYKLSRPLVLQGKKGVTLRGASGDPSKVILSGKGWDSRDQNDDIIHIGHCEGITIAYLTFSDCRSYGVKVEAENAPRDIHILHCHFRNIGVRAIKGSAGQDPDIRAVKGSVRGCYFENDRVPPPDWLFGGDYIAAIDMMALEDWNISDNVFRNIQGRQGGGRAAVFIWVRSRRVMVERNLIGNCDRGIAFGNPGQSTANLAGEPLTYVADSVIRNNFIAGGADCGIELWHVQGIKIFNNSIWRPERNWSRGIRIGTGTRDAQIVNNLVHGEIRLEGGEAQLHHNLTGRISSYFTNPALGELSLTPSATGAIDQAAPLAEVVDDIRRQSRGAQPDIGAWEFDR